MKKYFSALVLLILICCVTLTGCNLFERDNAAYLNQVVAKTEQTNSVEVTMQDLINGYNQWGYQYFQNENVNREEATKQIINDVIDRKYLLRYFDEQGYKLEDKELWYVKQRTYNDINTAVENLEKTIRIEWKWADSSSGSSTPENTENTNNVYTAYESKFKIENNKIVFSDVWKDETEYPTKDPGDFYFTSAGNIDKVPNASLDNKKLFEEARSRYFNNLKDEWEDRGVKGKTDAQLLKLEIDRLHDLYLVNAKITKLQNIYNETIAYSESALDKALEKVYETFADNYNQQKEIYSYEANLDSYREEIIKSDRTQTFYYYPEQTAGEYFYVTHLLLKFPDDVQKRIDAAEAAYKSGKGTYENYLALLESSYSQICVKELDENGKETGVVKYPADILQEVRTITSQGKVDLNAFRELKYKYQAVGDPGVFSSTYDYVIPMDESKDTMVKSFADEARRLRGDGSESNIGKVSTEFIKTNYGYHLVVYTGEVTNLVSSVENKDHVLKTLLNSPIKFGYNKTYFDVVYESISSKLESFDTYAQNIIKTYRNDVTVKWYPYRYKKFYE